MLTQQLFIDTNRVTRYQQAFGLPPDTLPGTFLLTLWQAFSVPALVGRTYLLIEQQIRLQQPLQWPATYDVSLQRTAVWPKHQAEIWIYHLILKKEGQQVADCETRIYVRPISDQ
jgi:hypothetical protein